MKRKIANIIEVILHIITLVVLFTMKCKSSVASGEYYNGLPVLTSAETSWFKEIIAVPAYFVPLIILWGISITMCLVSVFSKKITCDGKMHSAMPIIIFVVTVWCMISLPAPNGFLAVIFMMFLIAILGFVKRTNIITDSSSEQNIENHTTSTTNELKKYKELLDNGIITQEEFDAKKKQLLDL